MPSQKLGSYMIYNTIAKGRFSKIRYGENMNTKQSFAIKSIDTLKLESLGLLNDYKKEIAIMKLLNHPNVIYIHDMFATYNRIFLVFDLMNGKNLQELLNQEIKLNENASRYYFKQILDGIEYCHSIGITHENLKLECILLNTNGNIKINDFSKAYLNLNHTTTNQLTNNQTNNKTIKISTKGIIPSYIAPEIIDNTCIDRTKLDIWNLGIMLYTLISGYLPFQSLDDDLVSLFKDIRLANYKDFSNDYSIILQDLLRRILVANPTIRLTLKDIKSHNWFINTNSTDNDDTIYPVISLPTSSIRNKENDFTELNSNQIHEQNCNTMILNLFCNPFSVTTSDETNNLNDTIADDIIVNEKN